MTHTFTESIRHRFFFPALKLKPLAPSSQILHFESQDLSHWMEYLKLNWSLLMEPFYHCPCIINITGKLCKDPAFSPLCWNLHHSTIPGCNFQAVKLIGIGRAIRKEVLVPIQSFSPLHFAHRTISIGQICPTRKSIARDISIPAGGRTSQLKICILTFLINIIVKKNLLIDISWFQES